MVTRRKRRNETEVCCDSAVRDEERDESADGSMMSYTVPI